MLFLADENVPRCIVTWLRGEGHDVLYAAEALKQTPDADLLSEAEAQARVIVTEDKDFGELVFRDHLNTHGIILIRMGDFPVKLRGHAATVCMDHDRGKPTRQVPRGHGGQNTHVPVALDTLNRIDRVLRAAHAPRTRIQWKRVLKAHSASPLSSSRHSEPCVRTGAE